VLRLRRPLMIPPACKRIEKSSRDTANTKFEKPLRRRRLLFQATVRLYLCQAIKALDPVGTCFLLLFTASVQKDRQKALILLPRLITGPAGTALYDLFFGISPAKAGRLFALTPSESKL